MIHSQTTGWSELFKAAHHFSDSWNERKFNQQSICETGLFSFLPSSFLPNQIHFHLFVVSNLFNTLSMLDNVRAVLRAATNCAGSYYFLVAKNVPSSIYFPQSLIAFTTPNTNTTSKWTFLLSNVMPATINWNLKTANSSSTNAVRMIPATNRLKKKQNEYFHHSDNNKKWHETKTILRHFCQKSLWHHKIQERIQS